MKTRVYLLTIPDKIISNDISKRYEKGFIFFATYLDQFKEIRQKVARFNCN